MKFGIIGSGSWGTALAKILTDNNNSINWWIRNETVIAHLKTGTIILNISALHILIPACCILPLMLQK